MARYANRFQCGHEGCWEVANFECSTRKKQADQFRRYAQGQWRCVRHSQPDEVLGSMNTKTILEMRVFEVPHGLYWGIDRPSVGFIYGPGFKAFAKDFPPGTVLRVTAEIVTTTPPSQEPQNSAAVTTSISKSKGAI